jgi:hypothetical protein
MGQVTIYLDSETEKKLLTIVKKSGVSKSKWIADLIKDKTARTWPDHIFDLAGAWKDLPSAEEIRTGMGQDAKKRAAMKYCLDTNTLIYFFKGQGDVSNRLLATPPREIAIPAAGALCWTAAV